MPIYAYRCESCGHAKDVLQKVSDPLLTICPACSAESFKKQITAAGFQLKGSGWYATDFRNGNKGSGSGGAEAKQDASKSDASESNAPAATSTAAPSTSPPASSSDGAKASAGGCAGSCACH
jgi:putative FmdB family regulatory protein